MNIALRDVATRKMTWVTDLKWEASSGNFSPDGERYTYAINQDGVIDAYLVDRSTNEAKKVDLPHGLNYFSGHPNEFAPQSDRVIVSYEASNQPGDLWVYNLHSCPSPKCWPARMPLKSATFEKMKVRPR
jgi:Tol biopolymer transport system component